MARQVFGIDLGTTYSCISGFDAAGRNVVYKNNLGKETTPSVVSFSGYQATVGEGAKDDVAFDPDCGVACVKREMGTAKEFHPGTRDSFTPEMISAFVLKKLAKDVAEVHHLDVKDVVITCPAYFGVNEREATRIAGELAGLNVLEIINEPTAAAFSYGFGVQAEDRNILVYDLGGGTFDVTLLHISAGNAAKAIEAVATGGDKLLGGVDWDNSLAEDLIRIFAKEKNLSESEMKSDIVFMAEMRKKAEDVKRQLTDLSNVRVSLSHGRASASIPYTRDAFEKVTWDLLQRTISTAESVLEDAANKLKVDNVHLDAILLVGGSSKMPQVKRAVQENFGIEPQLYQPDEAVARGAALYARQALAKQVVKERLQENGTLSIDELDDEVFLGGEAQRIIEEEGIELPGTVIVRNVCSKTFGIICLMEDGERHCSNIIMKNSVLPCQFPPKNMPQEERKHHWYGTSKDNQTEVLLEIMENESSEKVEELALCTKLGEMSISGLPSGRPAGQPLEVVFALNEQGLLDAYAKDIRSGRDAKCQLQTSNVIQEEDIPDKKRIVDKYSVV